MKKFIAFMGIVWQQTLVYRAEHVVWFLLDLIPALVVSNLWVYAHQTYLVYYYIVNILIERLTATHFEDWMIDEVKDGKISAYLIKPFSYRTFLSANEVTWRLSGLVFILPSLLLFYPLIKNAAIPHITFQNGLLIIMLLPIIFLSRFSISYLIGASSFWLENSKAFSHFKWMLEGLFGGAWLPLFMLPGFIKEVAKFTPFYYFFYFPNQMLLGKLSPAEIGVNISSLVFWFLLLYYLSAWLWNRAIRAYSAVGN